MIRRAERYPTDNDLRRKLADRVRRFTALTGVSQTDIGMRAVNDPAIIGRIRDGINFQIRTYQRLMTWLDENWPRRGATRRKSDGRRDAATTELPS